MEKLILVETTITQITKDGYIKPTSPLFTIVNDGDTFVYIDNYQLLPGASFTINADTIVANAIDKDIAVQNNTQYQITFVYDPLLNQRVSAQLIEVFIKKG